MKSNKKEVLKNFVIHVVLIICCIISIFPILWIFSSSINTNNSLVSTTIRLIPEKPTLMHYKSILFNGPFLTWLTNSSIVSISTTLLCLVLGTTSAYAYSRFRFIGRNLGLNVFLILNAFPNILSIVAYYKILKIFDLLDNQLGLVIICTGSQLIFTVWNLKGYFDTVPVEIEEAAKIDGATMLQMFCRIILPLSKPALAVTAMFAFMAGWNEYVLAMTFLFMGIDVMKKNLF